MDLLNNVNTVVSLIAGLIAIGTAIASVFAKRGTVQRTIAIHLLPLKYACAWKINGVERLSWQRS